MIYPDTSFIFSLYVSEESSTWAKQYANQLSEALVFTPFHRLELRTALRCRAHRGTISRDDLKRALLLNEEDLQQGFFSHVAMNWSAALREAERIGETHLVETGVRSSDLLHVASAVVLKAQEFLTFDRQQADLADRVGLKTKSWPRR